MTRWEKFILAMGLGFMVTAVALASGCYAHTPTPICSADPNQPGCLPPLHDERPR